MTLTGAIKLVTYVIGRAFVRPILDVVECASAGVRVASAALIVNRLAAPALLMEINIHAVSIITPA